MEYKANKLTGIPTTAAYFWHNYAARFEALDELALLSDLPKLSASNSTTIENTFNDGCSKRCLIVLVTGDVVGYAILLALHVWSMDSGNYVVSNFYLPS